MINQIHYTVSNGCFYSDSSAYRPYKLTSHYTYNSSYEKRKNKKEEPFKQLPNLPVI